MKHLGVGAACLALALALTACAGGRGGRPQPNAPNGQAPAPTDREIDIRLMLSYDENSDGTVTRQELEDGLRRQFAAADTKHLGFLDAEETRAENDRRAKANGTGASPLIDWNQDGVVDFDEFATTARSVFETLDKNMDGKLTPDELRLPVVRGGGMPGGAMQGAGGRGGRGG
jgi:hypothetical protein